MRSDSACSYMLTSSFLRSPVVGADNILGGIFMHVGGIRFDDSLTV